ncbi:MAG: lipopolysaccharide kinase InaA family protein [Patescibacteria group bacterium]
MEKAEISARYVHTIEKELGESGREELVRRVLAFAERQFEIKKNLGRGKAADVWQGDSPDFKRCVCIKTNYNPGASVNTLEKEFHLQEKFLAAGVRAPQAIMFAQGDNEANSVQHGILVMEALSGQNVEEYFMSLKKDGQQLGFEQYRQLVDGIKEQIEIAHQHQLYHRDLHLRNIMIGRDGKSYLIDFGDAVEALGTEDEGEIYRQKVTRDGSEAVVVFNRDENVIASLAKTAAELDLISKPIRA